MKAWDQGQKCMPWISYPCNSLIWMRLTDPASPEHEVKVWNSLALLLPARNLHWHRELRFRQMFSSCRMLELGGCFSSSWVLFGSAPCIPLGSPLSFPASGGCLCGDGVPLASLAQGLVCSLKHFLVACSQAESFCS